MSTHSKLPTIQCGIRDKEEPWTLVSLEELSRPKNGYICMTDRWYPVRDGYTFFYMDEYPACNVNKSVVEYMIADYEAFDGAEPVLVPVSFKRPSIE